MIIHGIASVESPDTSAEVVVIKGIDLSSVQDGEAMLNWEHKGDSPLDCIGKIILAKKIYGPENCSSEHEVKYWNMVQLPYLYIQARLFDGHAGAEAAKAIIRDCVKNGEQINTRFSVEGSTLKRNGNLLERTIMRGCAMTLKPCNRGSVADVLEDQEGQLNKSENTISFYSYDYDNIELKSPIEVMESSLVKLKELNKAFTLGGSGGAPDTLSGGAAVAKEQLDKKNHDVLKGQVLAALRDWDKMTPFRRFMKHRLPDVDDKFIDRFMEIAQDIKLSKTEVLQKDAVTTDYDQQQLSPLDTKPPKGSKVFKNKHVLPGEIEIVSGPFQGNKLKLLHVDDKHVYVEPPKSGGDKNVKVNKINRNRENVHFIINKEPEVLKTPNYVHGDKHSDVSLIEDHSQKQLIHGIDLANKQGEDQKGTTQLGIGKEHEVGWYKNANGKKVYVKPAVSFVGGEDLEPDDPKFLSTARREVVFHNLAKNFFGLGDFVPKTSLFKHPVTGHEHSAMEQVPFASHVHINDNDHETKDRLKKVGDSGDLDRLSILDSVLAPQDRHVFNYLTSPQHPHVHLIDNSLIFNYSEDRMPQYLTDYHKLSGQNLDSQMHPTALKWLSNLDPYELGAEMTRQGVHEELTNEAVSRLLSMKSAVILGATKKSDILFAPRKFKQYKGEV
jgi:hypothetical protein